MKSNISRLIDIGKKLVILVLILLVFLYSLAVNFTSYTWSFDTLVSIVGYSIAITSLLLKLIDRYFWKNILLFLSKYRWLWEYFADYEVPILKNEYNCTIKYEWDGKKGEKQSQIEIIQTYSSINVTLITDEIRSDSIISEIKKQDNTFILYYIYNTSPKAEFNSVNPAQYGGCKIVLDSITKSISNQNLSGSYWTTSKTIGDIILCEK